MNYQLVMFAKSYSKIICNTYDKETAIEIMEFYEIFKGKDFKFEIIETWRTK